mgnify:CR=1 FL=1
MVRQPPRSTLDRSSAASDVYKRQPSSHPSSRIGKQKWVDKHLPGVSLILASRINKQNYSGYNKILIDDNKNTINEWKTNSGIGILFTSTDQVINDLKSWGF